MKLLKRLGLERRPVPRDPEKFEAAVMAIQVEVCVAELSRFSQERGLGEEHQGPYGFGDVLLMAVAGPRLDDAARALVLLLERLEGSNEVEGGGELYSFLVLWLDSAWFGVRESDPLMHLPVYAAPLRELVRQAVAVTREFAEPVPARQEWPHACAAMAFYLRQGRLAFSELVGQCVRYQERLGKPGKQSKEEAQTGECLFNVMRTRPEKMIEWVEKTYWALRRDNPDRDEHWLLANTWVERYGSTREAKRKGPEVTRFMAYKETYQFSILEPRESIRALALFLVHKELGAAAEPYAPEFGRIMEPVFQARADHGFFARYKEKNPGTVSECQAQAPGPFSLSSFLEGLDCFDQDPQFQEQVEGLSRELEMEQGGLL